MSVSRRMGRRGDRMRVADGAMQGRGYEDGTVQSRQPADSSGEGACTEEAACRSCKSAV